MRNPVPTLIIIDMQQGMARPEAGARNNPGAEERIATLLQAWRMRGAPVVHVRHISRTPGSPFWPGQPGVGFQPALQPLATEAVFEKNVPDAFASSGLERWLRVRDHEHLVVVGVSTQNSVESSVRHAGCLGFQVTVVADACIAFARTDHAGTPRSADEVHAMSLANLQHEYARIADSNSVLAELSA
jgi:nicotinamidase-related amidase